LKRSNIATAIDGELGGGEGGERLRVAILLPTSPRLRMIRRAAELAASLVQAETSAGYHIEVTVGLPEPQERKWRAAEQLIRGRIPSAIVRHVEWTRVPVKNARRMFANLPPALDLDGISDVSIPRDWGWNFQDCDLWISMADPGVGAILPLRPVTHYCGDLAQRYVPTAITGSIHDPYWNVETDAFRIWRQGLVITSDPATAVDIVSYAGVRRERIELIPDVLDQLPPLPETSEESRDPFLLIWLLRGNALDDLEVSLEGLAAYFRENGRLELLLAHDVSAPVDHHLGAVALPNDLLKFYQELPRFPYRSLEEFERILPTAGALWSSQTVGGEAEHVHDAVRAGLPLLAPDVALKSGAVERLGVSTFEYRAGDSLALADKLHELEAGLEMGLSLRARRTHAERQVTAWGFLVERMLEHSYA